MNDSVIKNEPVENPQVEDRVFKTAISCFKDELLPYLEIYEEVSSAAPTEVIHLELRQMYQDFNYVVKEGGWLHFEFVSGDITRKTLRTFRRYEAVTSCAYDVPVTTYVVYTGKTRDPMSELTEGINTYRVKVVHLKNKNADKLFTELEKKKQTDMLNKQDMISVILSPMMSGEMTVKERILRGIELLKAYSSLMDKEEYMRLEAMLYALATKFLDDDEIKDIVEVIDMTLLGELLMERGEKRGMEKGIEKGAEAFVEICRELGVSREDAISKLQSKFSISQNDAEEYFLKYWK